MKIDINNFQYKQDESILTNIHQTFEPETFNLIIGKSGEGKTTLLKLLGNLYPKYSKGIFNGTINNAFETAYMFQNPNYQFVMRTVKEEFIFALENTMVPNEKMDGIIEYHLKLFKIEKLKYQTIFSLSGGEKQKVFLAILISIQKDIIILDEPFANIDQKSRLQIIQTIKFLQVNYKKTIIITDHDLSNYSKIVTNVFQMKNQQLCKIDKNKLNNFEQNDDIDIPFSPTKNELISFNQLSIKNGNKLILKNTSNKIYYGVTLLHGENGCGKSTLLDSLTNLKKYSGEILINGKLLSKIKQKKLLNTIGRTFQNSDQQFLKSTVQEEIELANKKANHKLWNQQILNKILKDLNLGHKLNSSINNLSGGQKKKLQFLIMLMCNHQLLLLDEPFAGLDYSSIQQLVKLIEKFKDKKSFIIISHQTTFLKEIVDFKLIFDQQKLVYQKGQL
ncbi:ATP-binding cassette domain-containing protein [Lactobacillus sp. S2-2]|uniref:ATP-binding cassette domain-containing protein n=1 Tax=Lactobacillus sp. S2-2 TaxID=2692917 RepID=UPI001F007287|nr:ATP-binding cassette domain-containing protein [Lactobacillus sp. S2-2]MCF6514711.1 ATP-binding cassette domain-containing protein [Lactobacillus sp. S2-2]